MNGILLNQGGAGAVESVNGQIGKVNLTVEDISNNYITKNEDSGAINIGVTGVFSAYPYSAHIETGTNHFSMNEDNGLQYNTISSYDFDMYYEDINKHHKLSEKADKTYVDSKLSSVYRYKGTKDYYHQLPTENEIGDVYNIKYASGAEDTGYHITVKSKGVSSKEDSSTFITVLVDETSDEYADFLERYTLTRITIGENSDFSYTGNCEGSTIIFYRENEDDSTWEEKHYGISYLFAEGNDIKVISETLWNKTDCIVNNGDNVVWTGEEWDILAGVIDLSTYVTNDNVVNSINGKKGDITLTTQDLYNHFIVSESQLFYNSMPGELLKFSEGGLEVSGPPGLLDITLTAIDGATFETTTHKLSEKANQSYVEELEARIEALTARVAALEGN